MAVADPLLRLQRRLPDEAATAGLAAALAIRARPGDLIALRGELGVGKTAFARAFLRRLAGPALEVPSPSFTLLQAYETAAGTVWHFDLYRIADPAEALELGFEEALGEGILLVEWPERLGRLLPPDRLELRLAFDPAAGESARVATLEGGPRWRGRLEALPDG